MSNIYDKKITLLREQANKLFNIGDNISGGENEFLDVDAALGFYVLQAIEGIYSINQLELVIDNEKKFKEHFLDKCPWFGNQKLSEDASRVLDALVRDVYDYLKEFLKDNKANNVVQVPSVIVEPSNLSDDAYLRISGLDDFDISPDMVAALRNTDGNNMVSQSLVLQNPFYNFNDSVVEKLGDVSVEELKKILGQFNGDVVQVLKHYGFGNIKGDLFKILKKSMTPATILYSQASLRNGISFETELSDNLFLLDFDKKRPLVELQLMTLARAIYDNPNPQCVFGELTLKERKALKNFMNGFDLNAKQIIAQRATPYLTYEALLKGTHIPQADPLASHVKSSKTLAKRPPAESLFCCFK